MYCEIRQYPRDSTCFQQPVTHLLEALADSDDDERHILLGMYVCEYHAELARKAIEIQPSGILTPVGELWTG